MDFIHFFGTTGNKDIFFKKIRSPGGLYLSIDNTNIIIDPGVNTFYKYIHTYEDKLDGIILSHVHIDHSNDLNILVELMTEGGEEKRGTLITQSSDRKSSTTAIFKGISTTCVYNRAKNKISNKKYRNSIIDRT